MCCLQSRLEREKAASGLLNGPSEAKLAPREHHFGISYTSRSGNLSGEGIASWHRSVNSDLQTPSLLEQALLLEPSLTESPQIQSSARGARARSGQIQSCRKPETRAQTPQFNAIRQPLLSSASFQCTHVPRAPHPEREACVGERPVLRRRNRNAPFS